MNKNKLITLIILSLFGMCSCNYLQSPITIVAIEDYSQDGLCVYITNQRTFLANLKFITNCGKFQVGDTLKITK